MRRGLIAVLVALGALWLVAAFSFLIIKLF
jgi:hypothetical protein